jgi:hypothetical protein
VVTATLAIVAQVDAKALWLISVPGVRWGIETLGKQRIHPTLPMYLYLRLKSRSGQLSEASAASDELLSMIELPGNPEKPFYFPMIDRGRRDIGPLPTFWRATNISGSWSAGSIRRQAPASWLADDAGHYAMPQDNADKALSNLLYGERVSAVAMGAFFSRDDAFVSETEPGPGDLVEAFRVKFDFPSSDEDDFQKLFDSSLPIVEGIPNPPHFFEPATADVLERLRG